MTDLGKAGAYPLGDRTAQRLGYGAMQLAGPACSARRAIDPVRHRRAQHRQRSGVIRTETPLFLMRRRA